jgi:hypothetical protein
MTFFDAVFFEVLNNPMKYVPFLADINQNSVSDNVGENTL